MIRNLLIICLLGLSMFSQAQDRLTGKSFATRSEVIAQNGMAATSQPLATQAALDILKKGGSAVDAAIAGEVVDRLQHDEPAARRDRQVFGILRAGLGLRGF